MCVYVTILHAPSRSSLIELIENLRKDILSKSEIASDQINVCWIKKTERMPRCEGKKLKNILEPKRLSPLMKADKC